MYQVIQLEGTIEPWWLFDELQEDIVSVQEYQDFYEALKAYKKLCQTYLARCPQFDSREELMAAFWDESEQTWCEECGDMLQEFHSIALLENGKVVSKARYRPGYDHDTDNPFPSGTSLN
ncbi:DNA binding protein [Streptococcus sp. DD12]|nr:DNA binding protein [Streptococcus sp. DD12]